MARPYWSGQITISLVTFGVKLFVATEAKGEIHFHQISRSTGERVRQQKVLASAQEARESQSDYAPLAASSLVHKDEIVKGYEYTKGRYVVVEPSELNELRVPSKHTMEIIQFVDAAEIRPEYFEKPYFVVPENDAQAPAFAVVRQALRDENKVALSKIAFGGREHIVAITPTQDDSLGGMMAYTMRYAEELRDPKEYFRDIKKSAIDEDSLDLAKQLIKRKSAKFDPAKFVDGYEVALKELVQAKIDHSPVPKDETPAPNRANVISLMDALRKSISNPVSDDASDPEAAQAAASHRKSPSKNAVVPSAGLSLVKSTKEKKPTSKSVKTPKRKLA